MATLIEDIQTLLEPLAAGGAWYGAHTAGVPPSEYIVWLRIASRTNNSLSGPSDLQNTLIQIDVFTDSPDRAEAIGNAIRAAFRAGAITNVPLGTQDLFEEPVRKFRQILEYSIWAKN